MCANEIIRPRQPISKQIMDALAAARIPEADASTQIASYINHGPTMDNGRMRRVLEVAGIEPPNA